MTDLCPCGIEMKVKTEMSVHLDKEVDVLFCQCGKIKEVIEYGKFDKVNTAHDKFRIIAEEL